MPLAVTDALVIGGGIMGLLVARELHARGRRVILLDRDRPGRQASWASAGIVHAKGAVSEDPVDRLDNLSAELYPDLVASLRDEVGLDVEYTLDGWVVPAFDEREARALERQARSARTVPGSSGESSFVEGRALREAEPALGPAVVAGLLVPGGQVDNRRLVHALELSLGRSGVQIIPGAEATSVTRERDRVTGVRTLVGDYAAPVVVNAAGSWAGRIAGCLPEVPVVPQRGQILALWQRGVSLRRVVRTPGDPYLVPRVDGRVVVGATRELVGYDASLTAEGVGWLLASAMRIAPGLAGSPIAELWTGFRPLSRDGLPFIGPGAVEGLYFATGHGPHGISPAPGTARLLASLISGETPPIPPEPFDSRRVAHSGSLD